MEGLPAALAAREQAQLALDRSHLTVDGIDDRIATQIRSIAAEGAA